MILSLGRIPWMRGIALLIGALLVLVASSVVSADGGDNNEDSDTIQSSTEEFNWSAYGMGFREGYAQAFYETSYIWGYDGGDIYCGDRLWTNLIDPISYIQPEVFWYEDKIDKVAFLSGHKQGWKKGVRDGMIADNLSVMVGNLAYSQGVMDALTGTDMRKEEIPEMLISVISNSIVEYEDTVLWYYLDYSYGFCYREGFVDGLIWGLRVRLISVSTAMQQTEPALVNPFTEDNIY